MHPLQGFPPDDGQQAGAAQPTDGSPWTTPQELLRLEENDLAGLERNVKQLLEHLREIWDLNPVELLFQQDLKRIHETGGLRPSNLQLPIRTYPPTTLQRIPGGGSLDPHVLGVGCTVVPPERGRGKDYTKGDWHFRASDWHSETFEPGLIAVRMTVHPNQGRKSPALPGTYYKFMLDKPSVDFLVPDPASAAARKREPFVLIQFRYLLQHTRVVVPPRTTANDAAAYTPTDAPPTSPLASGSETLPERPASPDEVTGLVERLNLTGAASNSDGSDGGGGAAASGGGVACAKCGIHSAELMRCARCLEVAYCGKE